MDYVFELYLNKYHHTQCHLGFLLNLSSWSFLVLYFTFRSVVHIELVFVEGVRSVSRLIFFCMLMSGCFSIICYFIFLPLLLVDQLTVCMGFISELSVLLHDLSVSYQYLTILVFLGLQF